MPTKVNITVGTKYGRLIVIKEALSRVTPGGTVKRYLSCQCKCGTIKEYMMTHLRSGKVTSCGCFRSEKMKGMIGDKHYQWKGGQDLKSKIRASNQYKDWRKACYERDDYTCQISGHKGGDLVVHHLNPFHLIVDDLDDDFRESEILWELSNGITISKNLHSEFHNKYGRVDFTKEDFITFWYDKTKPEVIVGSTGA